MAVRHIYVACSLSRAQEAVALAKRLEEYGHQIVSTWHSEKSLKEIMSKENLDSQGSMDLALKDYHEICASNLVIVLAMPKDVAFYGGGHIAEFGMAIGRGTDTIVVGDKSCVFYHLPWVKVVADVELAVKAAND